MRNDFHSRIYRLKTTLVALSASVLGIALLFLQKWAETQSDLDWLAGLPLGELGSTLFITGAFVIAWDYADGRDRERREDARIRRLLKEPAPAFRDAVVRGFAVESDDLKRVANPTLLDSIATNVLSLRLGDKQFASEVYADIRDQAIGAKERWYDVDVSIRLATSSAVKDRGAAFDVTVERQFTTVPAGSVRRFVCVSDRAECLELTENAPDTIAWFMTPRPGFDARQQPAFELLAYTVNGQAQRIRRTANRSGQTYTVHLDEALLKGEPVRISYIYKTLTPQSGHLLFFDLEQPSRDLSFQLDYAGTGISRVSVLDLVASSSPVRTSRPPAGLPKDSVTVEIDGWVFPRAGIAFVWTLESERGDANLAARVREPQ